MIHLFSYNLLLLIVLSFASCNSTPDGPIEITTKYEVLVDNHKLENIHPTLPIYVEFFYRTYRLDRKQIMSIPNSIIGFDEIYGNGGKYYHLEIREVHTEYPKEWEVDGNPSKYYLERIIAVYDILPDSPFD